MKESDISKTEEDMIPKNIKNDIKMDEDMYFRNKNRPKSRVLTAKEKKRSIYLTDQLDVKDLRIFIWW